MPMPRVLGISLACLITSACAVAKTAGKDPSPHPGQRAAADPGAAAGPTSGPPGLPCREALARGTGGAAFKRARRRRSSVGFAADACDRPGACDTRGLGSWYDLVGRKTASGEILDTVTATAAHPSLPLASFAKVTDLDNCRSVVVKINDRGPYARGRIIDLSPRAADLLRMKTVGVASVVVEPVVQEPDRGTVASATADTPFAP
jgi:rare lipoprotein A